MQYCPACGAVGVEGDVICRNCGAGLPAMPSPALVPPSDPPWPAPPPPPLTAAPANPYYPPPVPTPSPYVKADFNWISQACNLVIGNLGEQMFFQFVLMLVTFFVILLPVGPFIPMLIALEKDEGMASLAFLALACGLFLLVMLLQPVISIGMASAELRKFRFGDSLNPFEALRDGLSCLLPGIVFSLIVYVISSTIGCISQCFFPAIFLIYFITFPIQIGLLRIADGERDAWRAFTTGWQVMQADVFGYLAFSLVAGVLASAGLMLCGVGILATAPMAYVAYILAYRANFERPAMPA